MLRQVTHLHEQAQASCLNQDFFGFMHGYWLKKLTAVKNRGLFTNILFLNHWNQVN
jgi:hypothetical protein